MRALRAGEEVSCVNAAGFLAILLAVEFVKHLLCRIAVHFQCSAQVSICDKLLLVQHIDCKEFVVVLRHVRSSAGPGCCSALRERALVHTYFDLRETRRNILTRAPSPSPFGSTRTGPSPCRTDSCCYLWQLIQVRSRYTRMFYHCHFHSSSTMASDERLQQALQIVGEAINVEPHDFQDHETWKFLGLGEMLAAATASDLNNAAIPVPVDVFTKCPTVGDFKAFLVGEVQRTENSHLEASTPVESADPWEGVPKPKVPLSVVLQRQPSNASTVLFLLPDGSGAGTSYATLPPIGSNICLIALNSPFLRQAEDFTCSIELMARLWVDEIRKHQPKGRPYTLGGWSAGGYYSFEVAKLLAAAGEKVERLILIDSPCRLRYEALPAQVVAELTKKGLMGASGAKKAPEWLVQHFTSTVLAVEKYTPVPLPHHKVPLKVNFIWVTDGLVKSLPESGLDVDMSIKVTRFLLEPRPNLQSEGWEILLPGATFTFDHMTGNHFQIMQPPHSWSLVAQSPFSLIPLAYYMATAPKLLWLNAWPTFGNQHLLRLDLRRSSLLPGLK
ncbi:hypothetical protein AC578_265 [Pseudocercospora eumusae]|uniref:Thioesterase domain-containing protein n=1 Tax=Pseudocercospora eumusae TaxID=321146 RepID=A0A139H6V7_9PEZI|nr:hypothetical protein AC578_265 [Pseudocercospora eumusae]